MSRNRPRSWTSLWLRDSSLLLGSQGISTFFTSFVAILIARSLSPANWGLFSAFLGLATSLSFVIDFGLTPWLLRELSSLTHASRESGRDVRQQITRQVSESLALYLAIGAVVLASVLVTYLGWARGPIEAGGLLFSLVLYMTLLSVASGLETVLRARRELGRVVLALVSEKSLLLLLVVGAFWQRMGLLGLAVAYLAAGVARLVVDVVTVVLSGRAKVIRPELRRVLRTLRRAFPFALNRMSMQLAPSLDVPFLALMSIIDAGSYALGYRVVSMLLVIPAIGGTALYPLLAGHQRRMEVAVKAAAVLGAVGLLLCAIGVATAPWLVPAVFGEEHARSIAAIQIMLLGLPFSFASAGLLAGLFTQGHEHRVALVSLASSAIGTVFVLLGEVWFSARGAGAGFGIRQGALLIGLVWLVRKHLPAEGDSFPAVLPMGIPGED